jgi:3-hydroxyacyl-CoA dehydrogenase / enoyl-CoA hydratase / 3-hydroxybutyryl-CoA epimerase
MTGCAALIWESEMTAPIQVQVGHDAVAVIIWGAVGLNPRTIADFAEVIDRLVADPGIKGVVITGHGGSFVPGLDLKWLIEATAPGSAGQDLMRAVDQLNTVLRKLESANRPFVAAINGGACGAGFELALACRRRIASSDGGMQLGLTDLRLGLPPVAGGAWRLARLIGGPAAQALLLAPKPLTPAQALKRGLVDELVRSADLVDAARRCILQGPVLLPDKSGDVVPPVTTPVNQPAPRAVHETLRDSLGIDSDAALALGARRFVEIARGSVARNMVRTLGVSMARANDLTRRPSAYPKRRFRKAGVLGAGLMGGGIALVCARAGLDVTLLDVSKEAAQRGLERLRRQEEAAVAAGRAEANTVGATLERIVPVGDYAALCDVDMVVEAVFEDRTVKAEATRRAEAEMPANVVFATNTSTLPIIGLAALSQRPEQFIGLHFFSPVPRMPLLEIIRGERTSDETLAISMDFAQAIGKTPIIVNDSRGFYTTRVVMAYQAEAFDMLAQGIAPELIERGGEATGMPVPPLSLSDAVGLDLIHQINVQTRKDVGEAYRQSAGYDLVGRLVEQMGRTGKKDGRGFYDYGHKGERQLWSGLAQATGGKVMASTLEDVRDRLLAAQALETVRALEEGVITDPSEADVGAILGWGFAPWTGGPLAYIDTLGTAPFVARCDELADRYGGERLRAPRALRLIASRGGSLYGTSWPLSLNPGKVFDSGK